MSTAVTIHIDDEQPKLLPCSLFPAVSIPGDSDCHLLFRNPSALRSWGHALVRLALEHEAKYPPRTAEVEIPVEPDGGGYLARTVPAGGN